MEQYDYDLVVIGSGPGGYVGAIRASQLGLKTAVIEKDKPGGVCLNIGCIPSKALIHQANLYLGIPELEAIGLKVDRGGLNYANVFAASRKAADTLSRGVEFLFKKNNITLVKGFARLEGPHEVAIESAEPGVPAVQKKLSARFIMVATGARPKTIPGFDLDEQTVMSSDGFLMMQSLPKSLLILGSGYIGMESAHTIGAFGTEVHVVEMLDAILPNEDADIVAPLTRAMRKRGIQFTYPAKALGMRRAAGGVEVDLEHKDGRKETLAAEKVLVAVGRAPNTENIGLEKLGIPTERGFIATGDYYRTNVESVYAIGDIVPEVQLAHVASKQAELAVEHMAGRPGEKKVDRSLIPMTIFTEPQIAGFGLSENEAKRGGVEYRKATFPYRGVGKAVAVGHPDGLAKVLYKGETHEILGAQIVGADASEVIHEMLLARRSELLPEDIATMIHAHPTISELDMEAMRAVEGWAIHA